MKFLEWYEAVCNGKEETFTYTLPRNAVRLPPDIEDKMSVTAKVAISMCRKHGSFVTEYKAGYFCVVFG
jgi:hypothetical protein